MSDLELREAERVQDRERLIWLRDKQSPPRLWLCHSNEQRVHLVHPNPVDFLNRLALNAVAAEGYTVFAACSPFTRCGSTRAEYSALPGHETQSMQWVPWMDDHPRSCKRCAKLRHIHATGDPDSPTLWAWQVACGTLLVDMPCEDPRVEEVEDALKHAADVVREAKERRNR